MAEIDGFLSKTRIAYFSMEIALQPEMHTYSGGLGVLAGDTVKSCADLSLPTVFVTLASHEGYLRQILDADGNQSSEADPWKISDWAAPLPAMVALDIGGSTVWIRPWLHTHTGETGSKVPVLLLDTKLDQNDPADRTITDCLYGGDQAYRLKQEIVLGIGGLRILEALGFDIETYHMNEGHSALLAATLLGRYPHSFGKRDADGFLFDADRVREQCVFTTHTPVEAGHDKFDYALAEQLLGGLLSVDQLRLVGGPDGLNMTQVALNLSGFINGVAERHVETAQRMYSMVPFREITNGIHVPTWVHPAKADLFDRVAPDWRHQPEELVNADLVDDDALLAAHRWAKTDLLSEIAARTSMRFDLEKPVVAFARRMTGYKRPDLIFEDLERLREIAKATPFQLVLAGKAHPADTQGQDLIRQAHTHMQALADDLPAVFLADYDIALARKLVSGADIWLNTPLPPLEASGTSGMKAGVNGVLNLSVLDGWWIEGWIEGDTGWAIGHDREDPNQHATQLYEKLSGTVLPLYYDDKPGWARMMKEAMAKIGSRFNSQRMMRRYASEAYLRQAPYR